MTKLSLIFKKHGEETKRNLEAPDGLSLREQWKFAVKTTNKRWPELKGTLQGMEIKR